MIPSFQKTCSSFRQARVHGGADGHLGGQGPGGDADLCGWRLTPAQLHLVQELRYKSGIVLCTNRPRLVELMDISADKGQVVTLTCAADGSPPPSYIWYRNSDINQVLYSVHIVPALLSRRTSRRTRARWWRWPARLTAHPRPATSGTGTRISIRYCTYCSHRHRLVEPTDISADKGQVVTLTCGADGSPPPSYIWYRNSDINQVKDSVHSSPPRFVLMFSSDESQNKQEWDKISVLCPFNSWTK